MMQLVPTAADLPTGSHSLGFYGSRPEAARNMASFLKGAHDREQSAMVLTADGEMMALYRDAVEREVPQMLGALRRIPGPHIRPTADGLRPVEEVGAFASAHPEGASMCGDTIPGLLTRRTLPNVLVYEDWFDRLRPFYHRGLCPYDLTNIPVDRASEAFVGLAKAHTHAFLSTDPNPGVQFLQLLVLPLVENPPVAHLSWLARAVDNGLIDDDRQVGTTVGLTPRGENFARALRALPAFARTASENARAHRTSDRRVPVDSRAARHSPEE